MQKILSHVAAAIRPSRAELQEELGFADMLVAHIQDNAPAGCRVVLTGSMAKGTFLKDKRDIDIFVLFDRSTPRESLEAAIKALMDASFPTLGYQLSYAEHPYARFHFEGRRIDLVPAYKIEDASERVSAVDRSVLHTKFVLSALKRSQIDEVLLLKQFLRSNSLYGAEIRVGGLSGYLCELLIARYGSFRAFVRAASRWKLPVFIDLKRHYRPAEASEALKRFGSDLVVVDPTDRNRNVAAAVSPENLRRLMGMCGAFLRKPSEEAFFRKPETFEEQAGKASRGSGYLVLSMPRPEIVDDILWGQLHKLMSQLKARLKEFGPRAVIADDSAHIVRLALVLERERLPDTLLVEGPPLEMKSHAGKFRKSHKGAKFVVKKGKLLAEVKRKTARAEDAIREFFQAYAKTKSHLAYPEEMVVLERVGGKKAPEKRSKKPASPPRAAGRKAAKRRKSASAARKKTAGKKKPAGRKRAGRKKQPRGRKKK
jgi:tRNA nucleotidyltransferase (CCA-adding enzyme)